MLVFTLFVWSVIGFIVFMSEDFHFDDAKECKLWKVAVHSFIRGPLVFMCLMVIMLIYYCLIRPINKLTKGVKFDYWGWLRK